MLIVGGPHPTTSFNEVLKDSNIEACIIGEGEVTLSEIVSSMIKNNNQRLSCEDLRKINGLAFIDKQDNKDKEKNIHSSTTNKSASANGLYADSKVIGQY